MYLIDIYCVLGLLPASTLVISYYHGLLLRDTNADSLIVTLYSTGLLTTQELNVILFGQSFHHRNLLLLECVRHMDSKALLAFSELVKDVWPQIGMQLVTGINYCVVASTYSCPCIIVTLVYQRSVDMRTCIKNISRKPIDYSTKLGLNGVH